MKSKFLIILMVSFSLKAGQEGYLPHAGVVSQILVRDTFGNFVDVSDHCLVSIELHHAMQNKNQILEQENYVLQQNIYLLQQNINELEQKNSDLIRQMKKQSNNSNTIHALRAEIGQRNLIIQQKNREIDQLQEKIGQLEGQIASIETSWEKRIKKINEELVDLEELQRQSMTKEEIHSLQQVLQKIATRMKLFESCMGIKESYKEITKNEKNKFLLARLKEQKFGLITQAGKTLESIDNKINVYQNFINRYQVQSK